MRGEVVNCNPSAAEGSDKGGVGKAGCSAKAIHRSQRTAASQGGHGKEQRGGVCAGIAASAGSSAGAAQRRRVGGEAWAVKASRAGGGGGGGGCSNPIAAGPSRAPGVAHAGHCLRHPPGAKVAHGAGHPSGAASARWAVPSWGCAAWPSAEGAAVVSSHRPPPASSAGGWRGGKAAPLPRRAGAAGEGANALVGRVCNGQRDAIWHEHSSSGGGKARIQAQHAIHKASGWDWAASQQHSEASGRVEQAHPVALELHHHQHAGGQQGNAHWVCKGAGAAHAAPGNDGRACAIACNGGH
jgi:hypothetical protein